MKGVIFTAFLEMLETEFGFEMMDRVILASELKSEGAYAATGSYPHAELIKMLAVLSTETKENVPDLMKRFGVFVSGYFLLHYPRFFEGKKHAFEILMEVDRVIHVEVLKLYPDASPPAFSYKLNHENEMEMVYSSPRKMAAFAEGIIQGVGNHYGEKIDIRSESLDENGSKVRFFLTKLNSSHHPI